MKNLNRKIENFEPVREDTQSDFIRESRKENGMTVQDLANEMYVSFSYVSSLETGGMKIKITTLAKLTEALNWDVNQLEKFMELPSRKGKENEFKKVVDQMSEVMKQYINKRG